MLKHLLESLGGRRNGNGGAGFSLSAAKQKTSSLKSFAEFHLVSPQMKKDLCLVDPIDSKDAQLNA